MSKDSNTQHRTTRQHLPTKIIVERHYVGTEKMETVFKRIAEEQVIKKVKVTVHSQCQLLRQISVKNQESAFFYP